MTNLMIIDSETLLSKYLFSVLIKFFLSYYYL
jgi:hypothetical protein